MSIDKAIWGIIPAAGTGSRIQPLAFSKELLPVGSRMEGEIERPRAVSEYIVDRMMAAGASKLCFVIGRAKLDILDYFGGARLDSATTAFVVQPEPAGLCDAIFRAAPLIREEDTVMVGLPDTIWFPEDALRRLPDDALSFLLFPVNHPERFDAVITDEGGRVLEIQVKDECPSSSWIWGAIKAPGMIFHELHSFWKWRQCKDDYMGSLVNAWLANGGVAFGVRSGNAYVDVGTLNGYREAIRLLGGTDPHDTLWNHHEP